MFVFVCQKEEKSEKIINIWCNFFFFLFIASFNEIQIDRAVSPLKPRRFHQIFVIYIIQQYAWDRFDKIYNSLSLHHELLCTAQQHQNAHCTFHLCIQNSRWRFIRHPSHSTVFGGAGKGTYLSGILKKYQDSL